MTVKPTQAGLCTPARDNSELFVYEFLCASGPSSV